jgi:hypothetical protein
MAGISKNQFETKVEVKVGKDEYLPEAGQLIQKAMDDDVQKGIPAEILVPQLSQMLTPDVATTLENALKAPPAQIIIKMGRPTFNYIRADGSSGSITQ